MDGKVQLVSFRLLSEEWRQETFPTSYFIVSNQAGAVTHSLASFGNSDT